MFDKKPELSNHSRSSFNLKVVISLFIGASAYSAAVVAVAAATPSTSTSSPVQSVIWKGHTWKVTNGAMAGVSPGSGNNVFIDANGFLHLKISHHGSSWTAAELFTTDKMGFGTYQWQIEGAIDSMDPTTVLGFFPYGPAAGIGADGENELDIEFSKWNNTVPTNADFNYYPPTGYGKKDRGGEAISADQENFSFSLTGRTLTTARTIWSPTKVVGIVMLGLQPLHSLSNVLHTHTYAPANPAAHIPQSALPLGINFWSFQANPSLDQEIVIRDFLYVPQRQRSAASR